MTSIAIIGVGNISQAFLKGFLHHPQSQKYTVNLVGKNSEQNTQLAEKWDLPTQ